MPQQLPCPNPACKHVFSTEEIRSAELVKCPACGRAFRFRPPGAGAPSAGAPSAKPAPAKPGPSEPRPSEPGKAEPARGKPAALGKPVPVAKPAVAAKAAPVAKPAAGAARARPAAPVAAPATPIARPVTPAPPAAPPAPPAAAPDDFDVEAVDVPEPIADDEAEPLLGGDDDGPLVRSRGVVKNRWGLAHYLILSLALIFLGSVVTFVVVYVPRGKHGIQGMIEEAGRPVFRGQIRNLKGQEEDAFKLKVAEDRWVTHDKEVKSRFVKPILALKNTQEDAWFVIAGQDYGMQRPREAELMKVAVDSLESFFGESLELASKTQPSTLGGEEAVSLKFKGTVKAVVWAGEVHMLAHHGLGYWLYVAAPTWDEAARVKAELEADKGLALATDRQGWREQPAKLETFQAASAPLSLSAPVGVWEKVSAKDEEETGELYLFGRFQREKDNRKNAAILIFTMEKKSDLKESMKEARSYVEKRKQDENAKYKLLAAEEGAEARSEPVGDRPGSIAELKLQLGDDAKRYYVLAVVHEGDKAFVARCDCVWEHRQVWRQDFMSALGTMKFAKGE